MPTLPDYTSLGQSPRINPGSGPNGVVSPYVPEARVDTRSITNQQVDMAGDTARAGAQLGEGIARAGMAGIQIANHMQQQEDQVSLINAQTDLLLNKSNLDQSLGNERDANQIVQNYPSAYRTAAQISEDSLPDHLKPSFRLWAESKVIEGTERSNAFAGKIIKDNDLTAIEQKLSQLRDAGLKATDPKTTAELVMQAGRLIDTGSAKGYWSQEDAFKHKESWTHEFSKAWVGMQPDEVQIQMLRPANVNEAVKSGFGYFKGKWGDAGAAGIMGHLLHESGGKLNPNAINHGDGADGSDSIGIGQWNGSRAVALKAFAAAQGKPWNDLGVQFGFVQHELETGANDPYIRKVIAGLRDASARGDVNGAAEAFLLYERPKGFEGGLRTARGGQDRLRNAQSIFGQMNGTGTLPDTRIASLIDPADAFNMAEHAQNRIIQRDMLAEKAAQLDLAKANAVQAVDSGAGVNPYDNDGKKTLDLALSAKLDSGADQAQAITDIVKSAKALPPAAAETIRMGVNSNDPNKVAETASMASSIMDMGGNAMFDPFDGGKDIEDSAIKFRHFTEYMGMTPQEAGQKIIVERDPAYKAKVKAQADTYGFGKTIKEDEQNGVLQADLGKNFGAPSFFGLRMTPAQIAFREGDRQSAVEDYKSLIQENYNNTGDYQLARTQAQAQLKKVWGVTNVTGAPVAMRYPPEQAPALANIPNASELIGNQVSAQISAYAGAPVDKTKIELEPIPGVTQKAYWRGEPPPYNVFWTDDKSIRHMLPPGMAYVPDVESLHEAARQAGVNAAMRNAANALPSVSSLASKF